jgi:MFS family permease
VVGGLLVQAAALEGLAGTTGFRPWVVGAVALGVGTALVYPTLLAAVGDLAGPAWRGAALGVYRFWRDSGFAVGGLGAGLLADAVGVRWAIAAVGALTAASGVIAGFTLPARKEPAAEEGEEGRWGEGGP